MCCRIQLDAKLRKHNVQTNMFDSLCGAFPNSIECTAETQQVMLHTNNVVILHRNSSSARMAVQKR